MTKKSKATSKSKMSFKFIKILLVALILFIIIGFLQTLSVTHYTYKSSNVPKGFDSYKILQLSDFHCKSFGNNEKTLINKIAAEKPDLIVFTGDMVDEDHDTTNLELLLDGISGIAPIYAVDGNHDSMNMDTYLNCQQLYADYGVTLLNYSTASIYSSQDLITITGTGFIDWAGHCPQAPIDTAGLHILLFHDSNAFEEFTSDRAYDIVFSGHTHGGILRLPFVGGLISTNHSLFPEYDGGIFEKTVNGHVTTMFSSRGLGDASLPRFYNSPELVVVTLKSEN